MITTIATLLSPYLFKWGVSSLDNAERTAKRVAWFIVLAAIALLLFGVLFTYNSCREQNTRDDFTEIRTEQSNATVQKDAVTIEAERKREETERQRKSRDEAIKMVEEARKKDSSVEQADAWAVMKRHCDAYPEDGPCKDGRYK